MGLPCTACGFDNDPTRVYCHSCGVKLDRVATTPPAPTGYTHPTDILKSKARRAPVNWGGFFGLFAKLALLSALAAAVYLALLPPLGLPNPVKADAGLARRYSSLVEQSSFAVSSRGFGVPSEEINQWLVSSVQLQGEGGTFSLRPERVYAVPGDGSIRIGLETDLPGAGRTWFEGDFVPVRIGGSYTLRPRAYSLGRLPVPVPLGWFVANQLAGLRNALRVPLENLAAASEINVKPDKVSLSWSAQP